MRQTRSQLNKDGDVSAGFHFTETERTCPLEHSEPPQETLGHGMYLPMLHNEMQLLMQIRMQMQPRIKQIMELKPKMQLEI